MNILKGLKEYEGDIISREQNMFKAANDGVPVESIEKDCEQEQDEIATAIDDMGTRGELDDVWARQYAGERHRRGGPRSPRVGMIVPISFDKDGHVVRG